MKRHVDLNAALGQTALDGLQPAFWADSEARASTISFVSVLATSAQATDALAAEVDKLKKQGIAAPFVFAELYKFLPHYARHARPALLPRCMPQTRRRNDEPDEAPNKTVEELKAHVPAPGNAARARVRVATGSPDRGEEG